jgi:Leucine-rich repeat (LRR) protein
MMEVDIFQSRNQLSNSAIDIIAQIISLKDLKVSESALSEELNPSIANLVHLEILEVQGNKLSSLPTQMRELVHLKVLNVSNNCLSSLPMTELSELPLTQIHASKNNLSGTLFTQLNAEMTRLQHLDVSINSIEALCISSLSLPGLRELNIAFNRISQLPDMTDWISLTSLLAEDNKLFDIPPGFTELMSIRTIDFTGNDFPRLDPRIGAMTGLETFKVAANPIRERKFLTMGTAEVKRDLRARMGNDEPGKEVD